MQFYSYQLRCSVLVGHLWDGCCANMALQLFTFHYSQRGTAEMEEAVTGLAMSGRGVILSYGRRVLRSCFELNITK